MFGAIRYYYSHTLCNRKWNLARWMKIKFHSKALLDNSPLFLLLRFVSAVEFAFRYDKCVTPQGYAIPSIQNRRTIHTFTSPLVGGRVAELHFANIWPMHLLNSAGGRARTLLNQHRSDSDFLPSPVSAVSTSQMDSNNFPSLSLLCIHRYFHLAIHHETRGTPFHDV